MRNRILKYSAFTVYDVELDPNERFTFKSGGADQSIGSIYVRGVIAPVGQTVWPEIVEHNQWRPRAIWGGWQGAGPSDGEATFQAGPEGARWLCLAENESGPRTVEHQAIDGSFILPAGWGFVVASGQAVLGAQAGEIGNYFAPREADVEVTGSGDLLLVR